MHSSWPRGRGGWAVGWQPSGVGWEQSRARWLRELGRLRLRAGLRVGIAAHEGAGLRLTPGSSPLPESG